MKTNSLISVYSGAALTVIAMLAIMPTSAQAQSITATANVATALTVTAGNDLDFGLVIPGFTKTIAVTDATAGSFSMSGGAAADSRPGRQRPGPTGPSWPARGSRWWTR